MGWGEVGGKCAEPGWRWGVDPSVTYGSNRLPAGMQGHQSEADMAQGQQG